MDNSQLYIQRQDPYFASALYDGTMKPSSSDNSNPSVSGYSAARALLSSTLIYKKYQITNPEHVTCFLCIPVSTWRNMCIYQLNTDAIIGSVDKDTYIPISNIGMSIETGNIPTTYLNVDTQRLIAGVLLKTPRYILAIHKRFASVLTGNDLSQISEGSISTQSLMETWINNWKNRSILTNPFSSYGFTLTSNDTSNPPTIPGMASAFIQAIPVVLTASKKVPKVPVIPASNSRLIAIPFQGNVSKFSMNPAIFAFTEYSKKEKMGIFQTFKTDSITDPMAIINTMVLTKGGTLPCYSFFDTVHDLVLGTCDSDLLCFGSCFHVQPKSNVLSDGDVNLQSQANTLYATYLLMTDEIPSYGCANTTSGNLVDDVNGADGDSGADVGADPGSSAGDDNLPTPAKPPSQINGGSGSTTAPKQNPTTSPTGISGGVPSKPPVKPPANPANPANPPKPDGAKINIPPIAWSILIAIVLVLVYFLLM